MTPPPTPAARGGPRVLFHGGRHAQVLQRIFRAHGTVPGAPDDCVVNFRLIGAGRPFPLARALACVPWCRRPS